MPRSPIQRIFAVQAWAPAALLVALAAPGTARAQTDSTSTAALTATPRPVQQYHMHPAGGPIKIDGILDEAAWQDAVEVSDFHEFRPGDNLAPKARTVCKLTYDQDHLYFSARCFDPDPSKIRAHLTDRDKVFNDDYIGIAIDTFLDHRTGYEFLVTPLGIQGDLTLNSGDEDDSWDGLWYSASHMDSLGWTTEVSIPTRTIRFRDVPANQWGFQFFRTWPRESRYQFCSNRISRDEPCWMCQYDHLDSLQGLQTGQNLQILPFATQSFVGTRSALGAPFASQSESKAGVTVKYGITPSITLDGTVHPDFAQVEADENQINVNNQSALSFSERRPFFLEGNSIFQGIGNLYYSRNIADPTWAGKLTGREGRFQFGILAARDRLTPLIAPNSDGSAFIGTLGVPSYDLVLRGRRDLLKDSNFGFTATDREFGAGFNRLGAVDAQIRLASHLRWTGYAAGSSTRDIADANGILANPGARKSGYSTYQELFWNSRYYNGGFWFTSKSRDYRADLGFQEMNDFKAVEGWHEIDISPAGKVVDYVQPGLYLQNQVDSQSHLKYLVIQHEWYARFKRQWESVIKYAVKSTGYQDSLYHHHAFRFNLDKRGSGLISPHLGVRLAKDVYRGGEHDYSRAERTVNAASFTLGVDLRPTSNMVVNVSGQSFRLKDRDTDSLRVGVGLGLLRVTYQFTPQLFVRLLSQYQRYSLPANLPDSRKLDFLSNQFLLSYKVNYATVFFLGLNGEYDNTLTNEDDGFPLGGPKLNQTARQAFAKVQYLWAY